MLPLCAGPVSVTTEAHVEFPLVHFGNGKLDRTEPLEFLLVQRRNDGTAWSNSLVCPQHEFCSEQHLSTFDQPPRRELLLNVGSSAIVFCPCQLEKHVAGWTSSRLVHGHTCRTKEGHWRELWRDQRETRSWRTGTKKTKPKSRRRQC